jgi:hypothetical protein
MYYARKARWPLAGLFGALAALSRLQGVVILVPLAYEYVSGHSAGWRRPKLDGVWLALAPAGLGLFIAFSALRLGAPLAMFAAGVEWDRSIAPPWVAFEPYLTLPWGPHGSFSSPLDLGFSVLLGGLVALCWTRLRPALALYATLLLLVFLCSGSLVSSLRYGVELFPIYIVIGISGRSRAFQYAFVAVSSLIALRFAMLYASGTWLA